MTSQPIGIGMIGVGGWGKVHVASLRTLHRAGLCRLVAIADPMLDAHSPLARGLSAEGIPNVGDYQALLGRDDIDAVVITTPIPLHVPQTVAAFNAGKHVYLEKPPCPTIGQLWMMEAARVSAGKVCAVGFQKQAEAAYDYLQTLIQSEQIGRLTDVWGSVRWPRDTAYYNRSPWAARLSLEGEPVFDGPATNALAHVIHAALSIAGKPRRVRGRLRRARPIESFDSSYIEVETESDVNARFAFTHASATVADAHVRLRGTNGEAKMNWTSEVLVHEQGEEPFTVAFPCQDMVSVMLDFIRAVQLGTEPATSLTATLPFLQAVNGAYHSGHGVDVFPVGLIGSLNAGTPQQCYTVDGLDAELDAFAADPARNPSLLPPGDWIAADAIPTSLW